MKITTAELITVGVGNLCTSMERVYDLSNFLTGDNLFTHQLPRAFKAYMPWVKKQHPWLNDLPKIDGDNFKQVIKDAVEKHGDSHELQAMPNGEWQSCDPIQEAIDMVGKDKVIVVQTP